MWAKVDDKLHSHPKWLDCGLAARGLWTTCLSWACDQGTDGRLPRSIVRLHAGADADTITAELVDAGLWEVDGNGWLIHNFLAYNPSAEVEQERRDHISEVRAEAGRRSGEARRKRSGTNHEQTGTNHEQKRTPTRPGPVYGEALSPAEAGAREEASRSRNTPPPPRDDPSGASLPASCDPQQARLMAAFRAERYPGAPADQCPPAELAAARQHLAALVAGGASTQQIRQATAAAIRRFGRERTTLRSVATHWSALLEPDDAALPAGDRSASTLTSPPGGRVVPPSLAPRLSRAAEIEAVNAKVVARAAQAGLVRTAGDPK